MPRWWLILLLVLTASCDAQRQSGQNPGSFDGHTVMGAIPPDTVYRGYFIGQAQGICGLVLIEAGRFAEDASIRFNTSFDPPGFEAAGGIRTDCTVGQIIFIDLVTGQSHATAAPASLKEAESFSRDHIGLLLL